MARKIDSEDSGVSEEEDYNDGGWINEELSESYGDDDTTDNDGCEDPEEEPGDEGRSRKSKCHK